ncbi:tight adherence protein C [Maritalea mobilis]|uniref:Tight adherence protein C n=1 Tax=Maritalea mobilis TaxID=483324 RepID=A0A4R6VPZ2_9HYPH|nr:type II secretion system F family protein [Maritalea mobilis]TDQ64286.1 tight adherence protein C [Maritalea mobilis]
MESLVETLTDRQFLVAVLAAISAAAIVFTFGAQFADGKDMKSRIRKVASERERLRTDELARLRGEDKKAGTNARRKDLIQKVVDKFSLKKAFADEQTGLKLAQAGYRGPNAVMTYVFLRFVIPLGVFLFALFYIKFIFMPEGMLFLQIVYAFGAGILSSYLPVILLTNQIKKRQDSIRRAWSDCLDLMLLCVESGMSIEAAFQKVSNEIVSQSPELGEEMTLTTAELNFLESRAKAYENMAKRINLDEVKSVMTALIQSERYGTSVGTSLRVMAEEGRNMRMMEAEKKAASLPPKLTVPLILFFLPVLFIVIMSPAMITVFSTPGPA